MRVDTAFFCLATAFLAASFLAVATASTRPPPALHLEGFQE
jgi:hypothetical protein